MEANGKNVHVLRVKPAAEAPQFALPPEVFAQLQQLEDSGWSLLGKLNIYTCDACRGHIVVRDIDTVCRVSNTRFALLIEAPYRSALLAVLAQLQADERALTDRVQAHVTDWRGVVDEDGADVSFSAEALAGALDYADVRQAFGTSALAPW